LYKNNGILAIPAINQIYVAIGAHEATLYFSAIGGGPFSQLLPQTIFLIRNKMAAL